MDHILYNEESPFGTDFFPRFSEASDREKTLFNLQTDEYLRVNTDDIILALTVKDDFEEKFEWIKSKVLPYFQNSLFTKFKIKNVRRIGVIYTHEIKKNDKISTTISSLTNETISNPEKISISFSKKLPSDEALIRKNVNDYKNTIYNLNEAKDALFAQLDYQYYYEPVVEDLRQCFSEKVLDESRHFLENKFHSWLNKYEQEDR